MRILWVPHTVFQPGVRPRADYFIERIVRSHAVHVLCWDVPVRRNLPGMISTLRMWTRVSDGITFHHMPRLPVLINGRRPRLTEITFRWMMRRIVREYCIDVVVCACNWYALGYPPTDLPVPLIADYFDLLQDHEEARYFNHCDAVLCASTVLFERAGKFPTACFHLPNGIEAGLFRRADGGAARERLSLNGARVVSLIGLTTSPRLYFVDAIELAAKRVPDVKCLIVGGGELLTRIRARIEHRPELFRIVEPVPYRDIPELFACSDVGLYPGDKAAHFDAALPIKVLEYSAAGKRVVVPPLNELKRLDFPNLIFADPTPEAFAEGICRAFEQPVTAAPDLRSFDLDILTVRLEGILRDVVARKPCYSHDARCTNDETRDA